MRASHDDLNYWRQRILSAVLIGLALLGTVAYVPSVILAAEGKAWSVVVVDTAVYIWLLVIWGWRSRSFRFRAINIIVIFYLLSGFLLFRLGPIGAGWLWLFAASVMTAVLMGMRAALTSLGLNLVIILVLGYLTVEGVLPWQGVLDNDVGLWIVIAVNYLFLNAVSTLSIATLLNRLERSIERERAVEAQLRQSQKLEAIGTLAGGIAHELNNILLPILAYPDAIERALPSDGQGKRELDEMRTAGERARDLVQQILTFGRQSERQRKPTSFSSTVRQAVRLVRATTPSSIAIDQSLGAEDLRVLADDTEIQRIVVNLCTNAYHAMRDHGGTMTVAVDAVEANAVQADNRRLIPSQRYVRLRVGDTGRGMDASTLERAFEPFFTTKDSDEGTGLGLSTVHGLVTDLGGAIDIDTTVGRGTAVTVYLPALSQEHTSGIRKRPSLPRGKGQKILLVDDEPSVLEAGTRLLQMLGYQVTCARNATEALARWDAERDQYELVVTDLTMPGMSGLTLVEKLREQHPAVPVIIMTGFLDDVTRTRVEAMRVDEVVHKPYNSHDLAAAVARALHRPA